MPARGRPGAAAGGAVAGLRRRGDPRAPTAARFPISARRGRSPTSRPCASAPWRSRARRPLARGRPPQLRRPSSGRCSWSTSTSTTRRCSRTLQIAEPGTYEPERRPLPRPTAPVARDAVWVEGGDVVLGAPPEGFAYDNERPRHHVQVAPSRSTGCRSRCAPTGRGWRTAATPGASEGRGLSWKERERAERPRYWTPDGNIRLFERIEALTPTCP